MHVQSCVMRIATTPSTWKLPTSVTPTSRFSLPYLPPSSCYQIYRARVSCFVSRGRKRTHRSLTFRRHGAPTRSTRSTPHWTDTTWTNRLPSLLLTTSTRLHDLFATLGLLLPAPPARLPASSLQVAAAALQAECALSHIYRVHTTPVTRESHLLGS